MGLETGAKLGPYEVLSPLGAGGMGEVYRARDSKLNRDVALKVLPETLARDPERMARFKREAQVLASLNHPNIATIYGFEESDGVRALAMELVEGQTLAELLETGKAKFENGKSGTTSPASFEFQVSSFEGLPIAKQIAEGLEYAHERGIIHRDLKPANIKITPEGTVKILDFGLAKALDPAVAAASSPPSAGGQRPPLQDSPTLSVAATQAGVILGTAAYMSPEQARGKVVDRRADIWAFGCVLYEMLGGGKPFEGETVTDVLASVVKTEPDWEALPTDTPARIRELIRRCLTKDPKQRLQAIGEARIAIEETISGVGAGLAPPSEKGTPRGAPTSVLPWAVITFLLVGLAALAGWWARAGRTAPSPGWSAQMLGGPRSAMGPRISPDGHTLAFQAMVDNLTQVAVMDTDSGDWTVLTKDRTRGFITELNWSPDGSEIYFDREFSVPQGIYKVSRLGGDERPVLKDALGPEVLPDGSLLVTRRNKDRVFQLYRFWSESGRLEPLDALPLADDLCPAVRAFHDGKDAVFFGKTPAQDSGDTSRHLYVINLASGKTRRLAPQLALGILSDLPVFPMAVASDDGAVLVDQMAGNLHRITSIPRNGTGPVRTLLTLTLTPMFMDVARNGDLYLDQLDRPNEVLRFSASGGTPESLASSESSLSGGNAPLQLPDGRVVFASMAAGRPRLLAAAPGGEAAPFIQTKEDIWFPACTMGKEEVAFLLGPPDRRAVAVASIADGRILRRLTEIPAGEVNALAASPDGETLYYAAAGTVWAIPASGGQPRRIGPGDSVAADPNGKDLIVQIKDREGIRLMRVPVSGGTEKPIAIQSALRLSPVEIGPNAVGKDGRVLVNVTAADSWFYGAGIVNPRTGRMERTLLNFAGDIMASGWLADGRVMANGLPTKITLWRFHPVSGQSE